MAAAEAHVCERASARYWNDAPNGTVIGGANTNFITPTALEPDD